MCQSLIFSAWQAPSKMHKFLRWRGEAQSSTDRSTKYRKRDAILIGGV
jgi:hypothetical protein